MPTAYLTIDDAPSAGLPHKLEILEDRAVPALLFCEGRRLADYPDHARRAVEAGYHLGNHAYSHRHASELAVETFATELDRTESLLADVYDDAGVSRPATLFRFPYGDRGGDRAARFQRVLETRGFEPPDADRISYDWYREAHADARDWYWTVDPKDWDVDSRAELRERIDSAADRLAEPSADVVLFHDNGTAPALLEELIDRLSEHGVELGDPLSLVQ